MNNPFTLHLGDCLESLRAMPDNSVDSIVTDPPYGLSFMGKKWDYDVPGVDVWAECLRVLKPGGHLLAFAGTRTQHRMAVRIEDAGFEIRDMIAWVYGSGFPKSLDVSKAISKRAGGDVVAREAIEFMRVRREEIGLSRVEFEKKIFGRADGNVRNWEDGISLPKPGLWPSIRQAMELSETPFDDEMERGDVEIGRECGDFGFQSTGQRWEGDRVLRAPATEAARQWQGWGTALKPALETVTFASKPYTDEQERDIIQSNLFRLEARLWLLSSANAAEKSSTSSQSEYGAAFAIAQWSAEEITNTQAALCGQMDTSLFELATTTSLSIVSSWRRTLGESWSDGSTFTIGMKSSTTIDWKTLKFSLSQITPNTIIKACSLPGGFSANASTAESHFNASLSLLQSIRTLSATEPAISLEAEHCRDVGVQPNLDPCIMARKPLDGTVAANVLQHGTGALNIDGCRVGDFQNTTPSGVDRRNAKLAEMGYRPGEYQMGEKVPDTAPGRWPANFVHDGSDEVLAGFPQTKSGDTKAIPYTNTDGKNCYGKQTGIKREMKGDSGSAARFFYCAKASRADRNEGLNSSDKPAVATQATMREREDADWSARNGNHHPTVKPTDLMAYLCRLVTPPGGVVLDPFMGSGSTGKAAMREGFRFIGCEMSPEYLAIAQARIQHEVDKMEAASVPAPQLDMFA